MIKTVLLFAMMLSSLLTTSAWANHPALEPKLAQELADIQAHLGQSGRELVYLRIDVHDCSMERYQVTKESGTLQMTLEEEYSVGTPKVREYPRGKAVITSIERHPWWYPTEATIAEFKKRGISLEQFRNEQGKIAVPPGNELNFMGPLKMRLVFIDPQKTPKLRRMVYRIHGNTNPKKLGTRCSGGCIRMDNEEIVELADGIKGKTVIVEYL